MMVVNVKNIGNSKGIILPKQLMALCAIEEKVNIEVEDNHLIISPVHAPRRDWDDKFKAAFTQEKRTENDMFENLTNTFDETDWTW